MGTLLGVLLIGAVGPALTFAGVTVLGGAIQGGIILAAVVLDAAATAQPRNVMASPRRHSTILGRPSRPRRCCSRWSPRIFHDRQLLRDHPPQRRAWAAGGGADADPRRGRSICQWAR